MIGSKGSEAGAVAEVASTKEIEIAIETGSVTVIVLAHETEIATTIAESIPQSAATNLGTETQAQSPKRKFTGCVRTAPRVQA